MIKDIVAIKIIILIFFELMFLTLLSRERKLVMFIKGQLIIYLNIRYMKGKKQQSFKGYKMNLNKIKNIIVVILFQEIYYEQI